MARMKVEGIIFDRDYTILDSDEMIYRTVRDILLERGISCPPRNIVLDISSIKFPETNYWKSILGGKISGNSLTWMKLESEFRKKSTQFLGQSKPFPGIFKTLSKLHNLGIRMAVISALPGTEITKNVLQKLGVSKYFDFILTSEDIAKKVDIYTAKHYQRKILLITEALKRLDLAPSKIIVVGDTPTDIKAGKDLGTLTIGVLTGHYDKKQLEAEKPHWIIHSISEISKIIE